VKRQRWAYHGAPRAALARILRGALRPGAGDDSAQGVGGRPVLFFADNSRMAGTFPLDLDPDEKAVLRFPWPADAKTYVESDEVETASGVAHSSNEYYTLRRVRPERIEVVGAQLAGAPSCRWCSPRVL
jgi:hypothetical protein